MSAKRKRNDGKTSDSQTSNRQTSEVLKTSEVSDIQPAPYELPDGWTWTKLGDVARYINGRAFKPSDWEQKGLPIIRIQNLTNLEAKFNYCSKPVEKQYYIQDGDLLISWSATLDAFIWNRGAAILNQHIFRVEEDSTRVEKKYLFYVVRAFLETLKSQVHGTGMQHITRGPFEATRIPLPPLPEQRRIVAKIERMFAESHTARDALERVPALLKHFRQSVLAAAFRGQLTERDPNDEPASALLERIQRQRLPKSSRLRKSEKRKPETRKSEETPAPPPPDTSNLPELPEGWVWATPEQLAAITPYALAIGPFGSNLVVKDYTNQGVPIISVRNIRSGVFGAEKSNFVNQKKADELRPHRVVGGDVLITKMGDPPGDACLYPEGMPDAIITADCLKWTLSHHLPEKRFFVYATQSSLLRNQILEITQGVAQQKMSLARFKTVGYPLPPLAEQRRIVARIEALFAQADAVERAVAIARQRADKVDQAILSRAFRGEL